MAILRQERKRSFMTLPAYIRAYIDGRAWRGFGEEGSFSPAAEIRLRQSREPLFSLGLG